jgi:hypothetical protein
MSKVAEAVSLFLRRNFIRTHVGTQTRNFSIPGLAPARWKPIRRRRRSARARVGGEDNGHDYTTIMKERGEVGADGGVTRPSVRLLSGDTRKEETVDEHAKLKTQLKTKQSSQPRAASPTCVSRVTWGPTQVSWIPDESHKRSHNDNRPKGSHVRGIPRPRDPTPRNPTSKGSHKHTE